MKELIRRPGRPDQIVIDSTMGDRVEDSLARRWITPATPGDDQSAPCVGVKATCLVQELVPSLPAKPLAGKYQGDLLAGCGELLEARERLIRRPQAHDAVMPGVAVTQLSLDVLQSAGVFVDCDKHGARHGWNCSARCARVAAQRQP